MKSIMISPLYKFLEKLKQSPLKRKKKKKEASSQNSSEVERKRPRSKIKPLKKKN